MGFADGQDNSQERNSRVNDENANRDESLARTTDARTDKIKYNDLTDATKFNLSIVTFIVVLCLSILNLPYNNLVIHLWIVVISIVCPLMSHFIPSIFYLRVSLALEDDNEEGKRGRQIKRVLSVLYAVVGAFCLPLCLTLATKALFTSEKNYYPCDGSGCVTIS